MRLHSAVPDISAVHNHSRLRSVGTSDIRPWSGSVRSDIIPNRAEGWRIDHSGPGRMRLYSANSPNVKIRCLNLGWRSQHYPLFISLTLGRAPLPKLRLPAQAALHIRYPMSISISQQVMALVTETRNTWRVSSAHVRPLYKWGCKSSGQCTVNIDHCTHIFNKLDFSSFWEQSLMLYVVPL
jgi:hypothetical protein